MYIDKAKQKFSRFFLLADTSVPRQKLKDIRTSAGQVQQAII